MQGEKSGAVSAQTGRNNAPNGENGAKSLDLLRGLRERGACAYINESSYFIPDYGSKDMEPWFQNRGKNRSKKGDAQNAADNKGNKIGTRRISEDFPGRDIVFAYLRQESDI